MCGILYIKIRSIKDITRNIIIKKKFIEALEYMSYRGPDNLQYKIINNEFFGHVRLSIIDTSQSSNQPIEDRNFLMIFNGEIYNYKELEPDSNSDTKTLFKMLERYGDNAFMFLRGMYAIGFYDKINKRIHFYRDFYGEKPLYYFTDHEIVIVSSTLRSVIFLMKFFQKDISIDYKAINFDYLPFGFIREPDSIIKGIKTLPPAYKMVFEYKYYGNPKVQALPLGLDKKPNLKDFSYVRNALMWKDVPSALLFSGGIDSTFLLSVLDENNIKAKIFIYKSPDRRKDESLKALKVLKRVNRNLDAYVFIFENSTSLPLLIEYSKILEQPSMDGFQVYSLLKFMKKEFPDLKVIYTGLGGDEIFGGYNTFKNWFLINEFIGRMQFVKFFSAGFSVWSNRLKHINKFIFLRNLFNSWDTILYYFIYKFDTHIFECVKNDPDFITQSFERFVNTTFFYPSEVQSIIRELKNPFMEIKMMELYDYARNQLLRDSDNISMFLGMENRSPLLNPDWLYVFPDRKKFMKRHLKTKYGLTFKIKRGFSIGDIGMKKEYLSVLSDFKNKLIGNFFMSGDCKLEFFHVSKLRALLILAIWLDELSNI